MRLRFNRMKREIALASLGMLIGTAPLAAGETPVMPPVPAVPAAPVELASTGFTVERVSPGVFRIGSIVLNKAERSVTFPAAINMDKGLLEYLLVRSGGKTHESLLRTSVEPKDLQLALLLMGLEGTAKPIPAQGALEVPTGESVVITLSVTQSDGRIFEFKPETWIVKKDGGHVTSPERLNFVFTGSQISGGRFMAQVEGSIISIYRDPSSIVDNASHGGENDEIWFVKEGGVPAVGTPVTVTITSRH